MKEMEKSRNNIIVDIICKNKGNERIGVK